MFCRTDIIFPIQDLCPMMILKKFGTDSTVLWCTGHTFNKLIVHKIVKFNKVNK